tara:strand:+ start:3765 stop:4037 length:273 start_codon:yes stop_codon:yes gene_type:complete
MQSLETIRAKVSNHMADAATTKNIKLFREGTDSSEVDFDASDCSNIATLRGKLDMAGKTCSVNGVIVSNDNLPINDGDRVSFTGGNKTGG